MNWTRYFSALRAINRAKFWLGGLVKARLDANGWDQQSEIEIATYVGSPPPRMHVKREHE
jgi:hypothetical protein